MRRCSKEGEGGRKKSRAVLDMISRYSGPSQLYYVDGTSLEGEYRTIASQGTYREELFTVYEYSRVRCSGPRSVRETGPCLRILCLARCGRVGYAECGPLVMFGETGKLGGKSVAVVALHAQPHTVNTLCWCYG